MQKLHSTKLCIHNPFVNPLCVGFCILWINGCILSLITALTILLITGRTVDGIIFASDVKRCTLSYFASVSSSETMDRWGWQYRSKRLGMVYWSWSSHANMLLHVFPRHSVQATEHSRPCFLQLQRFESSLRWILHIMDQWLYYISDHCFDDLTNYRQNCYSSIVDGFVFASETQRGFTKGSPPMNAALPVEEAYRILTDEKQNGHLVLLDAKAAFDKVMMFPIFSHIPTSCKRSNSGLIYRDQC
jgi:hypothetical protein